MRSIYAPLMLLLACAGNDALQRENDALRARIVVLEAQNQALQRQVRAVRRATDEVPDTVQLPASESGSPLTITVAIAADGRAYVDGHRVDDAELAGIAREAEEDTRAVLAADRQVPYQRVVEIMDVLRNNGISNLALSVDGS